MLTGASPSIHAKLPSQPQPLLAAPQRPTTYKTLPRASLALQRIKPRWQRSGGFGNGSCVALAQAFGFHIHAGAARNWPHAAPKFGYKVGKEPRAGAIVVTNESSHKSFKTGHVAYVVAVDATMLYLQEQNYVGLGIVSNRLLARTSPRIVAFIYPK